MKSMRDAMRPVAVLTAAAGSMLVLAACSSTKAGPAGPAEGAPVRGGTLTYLVTWTQLTLDPAVSPAEVTGLIDRNIFDSLVVQTGPSTFKPWLATRWTISPDGRRYTFHLKPGVTFTDGAPLNAAAVKATLDHVVAPATKSQFAASLIKPYKSAKVLDDATVQVTLSRPFRPFLQALSTPYLGIQSPKALAAPAAKYEPVGTGPYAFVSWTQQKDVKLRRNPSYTSPPANAAHGGAAYLQTLNFNYVAEDSTRWGALTSGQAQGIEGVPPIRVKALRSNPALRLLKGDVPGANYGLFLNVRRGPASDPLVRRALQAATDVPALVKSIYAGQYAPAKNILAPSTAYYDKAAERSLQAYDPHRAEQLLDQAGWTGENAAGYRTKDGKELELTWPYLAMLNRDQRNVLGEGIQEQAKAVGIRIDRPNLDVGAYSSAAFAGDYDILDASNARADADILRFAFSSAATLAKGGANVALVDSPELDGWLDEAASTADAAVARRDYAQAQAHVLEQAYVLPTYVGSYLLGASAKLRGVTFDPQGIPRLSGAWLAK